MRKYFDLSQYEGFAFEYNGTSYRFSELLPLAKKSWLPANIHESIYKLPNNEYIHLTVVGDEDQTSAYGILKGWYVAVSISEKDANTFTAGFAKLYAD